VGMNDFAFMISDCSNLWLPAFHPLLQ